MHQQQDSELVDRCLHGETDAYAVLVERYQGAVYATAFYYVGRYGVAEDVAQEAFWAAYRGLPHLKDRDKFGAWLKEVTTRTAANWLRRQSPRLKYETPLPHRRTVSIADVQAGPSGSLEGQELFERVQNAVDTLPERYRLPVILRYMQELSYEEISRFTGESQDEVRGILHRASHRLRDLLSEMDSSSEGDATWHRVDK